jgi:SulP family sulfate permease
MESSTLSIPELSDDSFAFLSHLCPYFTQISIPANTVLWRQSDSADGLYIIESGSLRATYSYDNHTKEVQETMVAGTIAGDLSTLSGTTRNATTVAERDCLLWKMDLDGLVRLEQDHPDVARRFTRIVLKGESTRLSEKHRTTLKAIVVAEEHDVLNSHLIAVLS